MDHAAEQVSADLIGAEEMSPGGRQELRTTELLRVFVWSDLRRKQGADQEHTEDHDRDLTTPLPSYAISDIEPL